MTARFKSFGLSCIAELECVSRVSLKAVGISETGLRIRSAVGGSGSVSTEAYLPGYLSPELDPALTGSGPGSDYE